jgi:hypothetical protein
MSALVLVLVLVLSVAVLVLNMRAPRFRARVQLAYSCLSVATRRHVTASDANPRSHGVTNSQSRNATACVVGQINEFTAQVRGQRFCPCDRALKFFQPRMNTDEHGFGGVVILDGTTEKTEDTEGRLGAWVGWC